jgi:UDP-3-O-[3-hydroxymyristoyl] glucosamine N-acyltransferase
VTHTLQHLATLVHGTVEGDGDIAVSGINTLEAATAGEISFYGNKRYAKQYEATRAAAVLVDNDMVRRKNLTVIRVRNPHLAFARIAALFHPRPSFPAGISPGAHVDATAQVDATCCIMAGAFVGAGAQLAAHTVLFPGVFVGERARIGSSTVVYNNSTVADRCLVGNHCIVHSGAVVGSDGFGFAFDDAAMAHVKIAQAGIVRVEDDVEIGANACIDRATIGETVIGKGSKIDNLVQVAHNCVVGANSILCAQVGLSGSTTLGQGVVMGGQSGTAGHLHIGDLTKIGAQSGILSDLDAQQTVLGSPSFPLQTFLKAHTLFGKLPELVKELRALRQRVVQLEARQHASQGEIPK